ncbi:MAG: hypothetical protein ACHREM_22815 [Polyangiales bacterium]
MLRRHRSLGLAIALALGACGGDAPSATADANDDTTLDASVFDAPTGDDVTVGSDTGSIDGWTDVPMADASVDVADVSPSIDAVADVFVLPDGAFTCAPSAADDAAVGTHFCDLYADFIVGNADHHCQNPKCHGGPGTVSIGPKLGWDGAGAYAGLTAVKIGWVTPPNLVTPVPGGDSRPVSCLLQVLAGSASVQRMPFAGPYLTADQVSRVTAWLARGAPFD